MYSTNFNSCKLIVSINRKSFFFIHKELVKSFIFTLIFIGIGWHPPLIAQSYFKRLDQPEKSLQQKLATFENGDLLIGDSYFEGAQQSITSPLFLTRMDECGFVLWSNAYEREGFQLLFKDFSIAEEEIYVYGSAVDGTREFIFLLLVESDGEEKRFQIFESQVPSASSFSLDVQQDRVLIMGRLLEIGTSTTGFIALFNKDLNFQWGKKFRPSTFEGKAIISENGAIYANSRDFHYKWNESGTLQWVKRFDLTPNPQPIGGPVALEDGFLFEAYVQEEAFFYKLNADGQVVWQSPIISTSSFPAAVQEIEGGNILIHYSAPEMMGNTLYQLLLTASGAVISQKKLEGNYSFNIGSIFQSIDENNQLNVVGNNDALNSAAADVEDFLLQFSLDDNMPAACLEWNTLNESKLNTYFVSLSDVPFDTSAIAITPVISGGLRREAMSTPFYEECSTSPEPSVIKIDSLLQCKDDWQVELPSVEFEWEDDFPGLQRSLNEIGVYRASNQACTNRIIYEYQLERTVCDCEVYLPNAFSPNNDGRNDVLELYTGCNILDLEAQVFDRWGNLIYKSQNPNQIWDGTARKAEAMKGIYILLISYKLQSSSGGEQEETLAKEVLLIR